MPTITATVEPDIAAVHLTGQADPGETSVIIERIITATGESTVLFNTIIQTLGDPPLFDVYDSTAPLDVQVSYRVTSLPGGGSAETVSVVIPGSGFIWFKDPLRPWASIRLDLCDPSTPTGCDVELVSCAALIQWGPDRRAGDFGLFPILDRERPVDVFARRKDVVTSTTFVTRTCECIDDVYTLFTAGGPIFVQLPAVYCTPDRYYQPGDLDMSFASRDQRKPWRLWTVPLTAVDAPAGIPQGVEGATWCDVEDQFDTFADLTASGLTWADILDGETNPVPADGYGEGAYGSGPYGDGG